MAGPVPAPAYRAGGCVRSYIGRNLKPAGEDEERGATDRQRHVGNLMGNRAPNTDTGEPETSSDALLDELVRALARQAAERDYAALRNKTRNARRPPGGKKDLG